MKYRSRITSLLVILALMLSMLASCDLSGNGGQSDTGIGDSEPEAPSVPDSISIRGDDEIELALGDTLQLIVDISVQKSVTWVSSSPAVSVEGGLLSAEAEGSATVTATLGSASDSVTVTVIDESASDILPDDPTLPDDSQDGGADFDTDPYENMSAVEFYANYQPAVSYMDAYYRSLHGFMSGSIEPQDQDPSIAAYRPMQDGKYIRNSVMLYGEGGNAYYVTDGYGNIVNAVFRGGAYVSLEDVAAYLYAFGDIPANHTAKKSGNPRESKWGEYLRLNHSNFSGDVVKYPYEPELPNISGCGGRLYYKEIDIGTTGTDCDPSYDARVYNDGNSIVRGAARIVYGKNDLNGNGTYEIGELYLFYTNNHYNDFREYLNYEGGWGEIFGNVTGGGVISSKTNYSPTPYVAIIVLPIKKEA